MYCVRVYFHGPETAWSGSVSPRETIAIFTTRYLWLARARARNIVAGLNIGKCGYAITLDEETIDHQPAPGSALDDAG